MLTTIVPYSQPLIPIAKNNKSLTIVSLSCGIPCFKLYLAIFTSNKSKWSLICIQFRNEYLLLTRHHYLILAAFKLEMIVFCIFYRLRKYKHFVMAQLQLLDHSSKTKWTFLFTKKQNKKKNNFILLVVRKSLPMLLVLRNIVLSTLFVCKLAYVVIWTRLAAFLSAFMPLKRLSRTSATQTRAPCHLFLVALRWISPHEFIICFI